MFWFKKALPMSEMSGILIYDLAIKECHFKLCYSKISYYEASQLGDLITFYLPPLPPSFSPSFSCSHVL
jgi:hypothetical protein